MKTHEIPLAALIALAFGGAAWSLSQASMIARPAILSSNSAAPPGAVPLRLRDERPVDADYAVPGVLDYRSWKPAYDVRPRALPVFAVARHAAPRSAPVDQPREDAAVHLISDDTALPEDAAPSPIAAAQATPAVLLPAAAAPTPPQS